MDAFTQRALAGNPAGVVPNADALSDEQMQAIAQEVHASETVFVLSVDGTAADLRLRYFTPTTEVDLCGHATIGAICGLAMAGRLTGTAGVCQIETRVGILPVRYGISADGVWAEMRQDEPRVRPDGTDLTRAMALLGLQAVDLDPTWPAGISYTGLWDLFVPLRGLDAMARITPDLAGIAQWNRELGVASTHVYTAETVTKDNDFHARDFSPALGIPEDPATGTATGALIALLHQAGRISPQQVYRFEQGFEMGRPGVLSGRIETQGASRAVYVGGYAVRSLSGVLHL